MKPAASNDACGPALLVAQTSFLVDGVLTPPLVSALRRRLMPRRLALLVRPEAVPLVAGHPDIDQVLVDDKRGADRGALGWLGTARRLRAERFEVAVSPHRSLRPALVLPAAGIPRPVGFRESRRPRLLHERVPRDRGRPAVEGNPAPPAPPAGARGVRGGGVFCPPPPALGSGRGGPRAAGVEADLACRPCARHGGRHCPRGTEDCMRLVAPAAVLAAARAALGVALAEAAPG